ncbi:hypothetical protein PHYNN_126 [Pantoea phage Phynn]|nr:hypothetical protein PHYNN_126 [Pantoea phage Phynn]
MQTGRNDSCRVVNKYKSDFDVDIQRGTKWGNPFKLGNRGESIAAFIPYFQGLIRSGEITIAELRELDSKTLGCSCAPLPCHGDYIAHCVNVVCGKVNTLDI